MRHERGILRHKEKDTEEFILVFPQKIYYNQYIFSEDIRVLFDFGGRKRRVVIGE